MTGCGGSFIGCPSSPLMPQPQGSPFTPSALRSAPVNTASTPGMARAAPVSMDLIFACACGEPRKRQRPSRAARYRRRNCRARPGIRGPPCGAGQRQSRSLRTWLTLLTAQVYALVLCAAADVTSSQGIVNCPKHQWLTRDRFNEPAGPDCANICAVCSFHCRVSCLAHDECQCDGPKNA